MYIEQLNEEEFLELAKRAISKNVYKVRRVKEDYNQVIINVHREDYATRIPDTFIDGGWRDYDSWTFNDFNMSVFGMKDMIMYRPEEMYDFMIEKFGIAYVDDLLRYKRVNPKLIREIYQKEFVDWVTEILVPKKEESMRQIKWQKKKVIYGLLISAVMILKGGILLKKKR